MTIDAATLERAVRRWWWTHRNDEGTPFGCLPQLTQNAIMASAIHIWETECQHQHTPES